MSLVCNGWHSMWNDPGARANTCGYTRSVEGDTGRHSPVLPLIRSLKASATSVPVVDLSKLGWAILS